MIKKRAFKTTLLALPDGAYDVHFQHKRYGLIKSTHLQGALVKLYAKQLGGNDFISLNYYPQLKEGLKPCEMPQSKVIDFVLGLTKD